MKVVRLIADNVANDALADLSARVAPPNKGYADQGSYLRHTSRILEVLDNPPRWGHKGTNAQGCQCAGLRASPQPPCACARAQYYAALQPGHHTRFCVRERRGATRAP